MINEKHRTLKDILMIFSMILVIVLCSYLLNAFKFSFDSVNHFEIGSSYTTKERNDRFRKLEILNDESGRLITFVDEISNSIYYFDYIFDKEAGIVSVSFVNDTNEARDYYIIKDGLYDSLDRVYYYSN